MLRRSNRPTRSSKQAARLESPIEGNYRNWSDLDAYRAEARRARAALTLLRSPGPRCTGIRLFSVMRNESHRLRRFLDHYRRLGIERFVIVDNASADGSVEFLLDQPDVELHLAASSYAAANGGSLWIDGLMLEQAVGSWVLYVDADELLVYDDWQRHPLPVLAERLHGLGERNLLAPLLDVYPCPGWQDEVMFDASPELLREDGRGPFVEGGPRARMARAIGRSEFPCLTKYPFTRYGRDTAFANTHFPYPSAANSYAIRGRLLHAKIDNRFRDKVAAALREGQHWNDGAEYRRYAEWLRSHQPSELPAPLSRRYTGAADLVNAGLLLPLDWHRPNSAIKLAQAMRRLLPRRARDAP